MDGVQKRTEKPAVTENPKRGVRSLLSPQQNEWISFCATGGLVTYADGDLETMTVKAFADLLGVRRATLYEWRETIPNFWQLVDERRRHIFSADRVAKVWNGVFLRAAKGDAKQAEMILSHFGGYVPPAQKHEVKVDGFADLVNMARLHRAKVARDVQDGELVQPPQIEAPAPQTASTDEFE